MNLKYAIQPNTEATLEKQPGDGKTENSDDSFSVLSPVFLGKASFILNVLDMRAKTLSPFSLS
jgi:hypothetical protein